MCLWERGFTEHLTTPFQKRPLLTTDFFFFVFPIYFSLLFLLKPSLGFTKLIFPFICLSHPPPFFFTSFEAILSILLILVFNTLINHTLFRILRSPQIVQEL